MIHVIDNITCVSEGGGGRSLYEVRQCTTRVLLLFIIKFRLYAFMTYIIYSSVKDLVDVLLFLYC